MKCDVHPDMNLEEGHLGGYIRSRHSCVPTVYRFEHGDPATYFPDLWRWAVDEFSVRSVIDVGCGEGHAARYFRDLGFCVLAVDGSVQAMHDSRVPEQHVGHDYTKGRFIPDASFDLVWCCEFVEHVEAQYLENFLATFSRGSNLMMTYAGIGQPGHHHVNCQPEGYWIEKLGEVGFRLDADRTRIARAIAAHGHFGLRGLVFVR